MSDVPETAVVHLLQVVVAHSLSKSDTPSVGGASATPIPSLPQFLSACIGYPMSMPSLRASIKEHLHKSEDLCALLGLLVHWVRLNCGRADELGVELASSSESTTLKKSRRNQAAAQFHSVSAVVRDQT